MKNNKGQVQTNNAKINVLVDTTNSDNRHYHYSNRKVSIVKVLSNDEIIEAWRNRPENDELELAKRWIAKQTGFATSNCEDETLNIDYSSIVKFNE